MQFKKSLMTAILVTIGGFAAMSSANAASPTSSSFGVSMDVESICTIDAAPVAVVLAKTEAGKATTAVTATTDLILNCSKGSVAVIGLTPASTTSLDGTGTLLGGDLDAEEVAYKLTSGSASGTAWGTTNTVSTEAFADYATAITTPIYLTVTSDADVTPGPYADTINISVAY
ncbi:spore coat protein U domain-containing protein [Psychrobacter sp. PAMC 21119]|uniref:spore coat protein U domain-containing protein n=1 Tax=Psychrobacter sp. PAMC 21119 TaxID=1112209 RepID=UPI00028A2F3A|nr:spore coat protein U domain-containing protein [Psychrobacter sp. PAMC 21119]